MKKGILLLLGWLTLSPQAAVAEPPRRVVVASKKFTESVILGEIVARLIRSRGIAVDHQAELGGTQILWKALLRGDVDAYVEYTGTLRREMFHNRRLPTDDSLKDALHSVGLAMSAPLGFNNTYALAMTRTRARERGIRRISDLRGHPDLAFAFTEEFLNRADGWPALRSLYDLPHDNVRGMDHDLAYRGLTGGGIDVVDSYSTDAEIAHYDLVTLEDDRNLFPRYDAVVVYRLDLRERIPELPGLLRRLGDTISEEQMIRLNAEARLQRQPESLVAARFLEDELGIESEVKEITLWQRLARTTAGHLYLVLVSLSLTVVIALPLGIAAARSPRLGQLILAVTGIFQTIPSLALLVFMIPWLGIGTKPAIAALFLYALLPIVRNTYTGLRDIPYTLIESAEALGMTRRARLWKVELPLASSSILAGIKTSAVINIGTATLGALVGAGGYGEPILTGIRLDDLSIILEGAVPAAALALFVQGLFELSERFIVPKGLRIRPEME